MSIFNDCLIQITTRLQKNHISTNDTLHTKSSRFDKFLVLDWKMSPLDIIYSHKTYNLHREYCLMSPHYTYNSHIQYCLTSPHVHSYLIDTCKLQNQWESAQITSMIYPTLSKNNNLASKRDYTRKKYIPTQNSCTQCKYRSITTL